MKNFIQILALLCWPLIAGAEPQPAPEHAPTAPATQAPIMQEQPAPKIGASAAAQIEELKEQMRGLRGEIEQLQFENSKLNEKFVKFAADVDFRFNELSKKDVKQKEEDKVLSDLDEKLDNDVIQRKGDSAKADQARQNEKAATAGAADAKAAADPKSKDQEVEQQYQDAYSKLKTKNYKEARDQLTKFVTDHPNHELTGNAYYWLGETYFINSEYDKSAVQYLKGYQANIRGSRAADNLLKLGKSMHKMDKIKEACTTLVKLNKEFPNASNSIKKSTDEEIKALNCAK